jgi:glycosyltransferase involved in cell wall biosynthesis
MHLVHLTASTQFGGPERQMLGLADHLRPGVRTTCVSFREGGRCGDFLREAADRGQGAVEIAHDTPRLRAAARELTALLGDRSADVLLCHGYKANLVGRVAARRVGIPAVAVSRGWTGESAKVRVYEALDRWHLRFMDHVVCVSDGQAAKVMRAGVPADRVSVIRNSARPEAFANPDPRFRAKLVAHFPGDAMVRRVVVAAGRLSPEKGFAVLVEAAAQFLAADPGAGVVLFGDGPERPLLERRVADLGLSERFALPGFTRNLDKFLPWADVAVLPSFTEGLPNVALEASAAGVPVVATAVGGTPEAVTDGETGLLVPPGEPGTLAARVADLLGDVMSRRLMGEAGRAFVRERFSFATQAAAYRQLFAKLLPQTAKVAA